MSTDVSSFNHAGNLNVPYGQRISSSRQIIENASYTTTPSYTPPVKEFRPFSAHDHHRSGPTIAAVLKAIQALKHYREKEEKPAARPICNAGGNYQQACAEQVARRKETDIGPTVKSADGKSSGDARTGMSSEQEMCPWSYEDRKRKMHLSLMCVEESWTNCK